MEVTRDLMPRGMAVIARTERIQVAAQRVVAVVAAQHPATAVEIDQPGTRRGRVAVIGAGVAGEAAAVIARITREHARRKPLPQERAKP